MKITSSVFAATMATALSLGSAVSADTVNLETDTGGIFGPSSWFTSVSYTINGTAQSHASGAFHVRDSDTGDTFLAWCIDLFQNLELPHAYDTAPTIVSADELLNIGKLFATASESVVDAVSASGFQIALWEIVSDTGSSDGLALDSGDFVTTGTGAQYDMADEFLTGLDNLAKDSYDLTTYFSATSQDLVSGELTSTNGGSQTPPVPLPASLPLLAAGLLGVFGLRSRKNS